MDGAQLDLSCAYKEKAGILQNQTACANAAKMPPEAWYEMYVKRWHPVICLKSFQRRRVSVTGLLTGTSTQGSATGLILQPLRSLSMFTQNIKLVASNRDADKLKGTMKE